MSKITMNRGRRVHRNRWMLNTTVSPYLIAEIDEICSKRNLTRSWVVERALVLSLPIIRKELGLVDKERRNEGSSEKKDEPIDQKFLRRLICDTEYRKSEWQPIM